MGSLNMGSTESPGIMKSKVLCVVFSLFGLFALSSAFYGKQLKPLYPFNGGESFETTPFAPANDQAWINMMWWKSLAGKPVESVMGPVDPYNTDEFSFNNFLLDALYSSLEMTCSGCYNGYRVRPGVLAVPSTILC